MRSFAPTLLLLAGCPAYAQTFEVASIKATAPQESGRIMVRMGGDPGRIDYVNVSLRDLVRQAYDVKDYQVVAPDWMNSARFDVQAKLPPDTPKEVRAVMMQALLAERFGLKTHKESKEVQVYSLVVGKNGPKLKKAEEIASTPPPGSGPGGPAAVGSGPGPRNPGGGGRGAGGAGMMRIMMQPGGKMHMTANGM